MKKLKPFIALGILAAAFTGWEVANAATFTFGTSGNTYTRLAKDQIQLTDASGLTLNVFGRSNTPEAKLGVFDTGLGVQNSKESSSEHYIDNYKQTDYALFKFSKAVKIEKIVLTIWADDGDMTLGYGSTPTIFDHFYTTKTSGEVTINLSSTPSDEIWRIFASLQNTEDGGKCRSSCRSKIDGFKIRSITVAETPVPLPAAAWLFGSAMLGMAGFSARKRLARG